MRTHRATTLFRRLAATLVGVAATAVLAAPALAVGTDGVELMPLLPRGDDGRHELRLEGAGTARISVRNLTDEPRSVRVFVADVEATETGSFRIGPPGTSPYATHDEHLELPAAGSVDVAISTGGTLARGEVGHLALVLEAKPSSSLVTQAANVIRVLPPPALLQRTGPLVLAVVLFMTAVAALARFGGHRVASPPAEEAEPVGR